MWKPLCILGFGAMLVLGSLCESKAALTARSTIILHKDSLSLSDIFKGLEPTLDVVVSRAPKAGGDFRLSKAWMTKTMQNHNINWSPKGSFRPILVKRHGFVVSAEDFSQKLEESLKAQSHLDQIHLEIRGNTQALIVPTYSPDDLAPNLRIESLQVQGDRFKAILSVGQESLHVQGRFSPLIDVPTVGRPLARGSLITQADIDWIKVPASHISASTILDETDLIGKTAKGRLLKASAPITNTQIVRPIVVKRGEIITLNVKSPGLFLSTQGKALEKGGAGDTIRVMPLDTGRVIYATLSQGGVAEITLASTATGSAVS
ncbi:MAG: flagellar basal body P-ring formation protein FlgA [bacterium]|nr:flagellar basal body P-ring formation protein FlgA [bacterium]